MAVRKRRSAPKGPTGPSSRVHNVESAEQWQNMLDKAAKGRRLLVVQLFQANNYACSQMRHVFKRMSVDPAMRAAVFAEVEVDVAEDELLDMCGVIQGVTKVPCYRCYVEGEDVESYSGGQPAQVAAMIQRQLAELRSARGGRLLTRLLLAAGGAAALAAGALYWHVSGRGGGGRAGGGGSSRDLAAELQSLSERIRTAQRRKLNCERAGKLKGAKTQGRLIRQLEGSMQAVQQQMQQRRERDQPSGGSGSGGSAATAAAQGGSSGGPVGSNGSGRRRKAGGADGGGAAAAPSGRREAAAGSGSSPLPWGMEPADYSSEDDGEERAPRRSGSSGSRRRSRSSSSSSRRRRGPAPAVLYSDEEE